LRGQRGKLGGGFGQHQLILFPYLFTQISRKCSVSIPLGRYLTGTLPQAFAMADARNLRLIVKGVMTEMQASYFAACEQAVSAQRWALFWSKREVSAVRLSRFYSGNPGVHNNSISPTEVGTFRRPAIHKKTFSNENR
jgi:hypothetical protein